MQRWVMFNYLIGNADAPAKILSVLVDDKGFRKMAQDLLSAWRTVLKQHATNALSMTGGKSS